MTHECGAHAEWKNYEILLFVMLTSILTWKSNAHQGGPHLWVNFLIVRRETPVKCPGMPRGWAVLELNGTLPLLSWLKKKMFWFQSHWNNAIDAKTAGQFDSSIMMKWFALNFLVHSEQWMSCGRWKSAQQKICASTSQLGLYLMNILIFVSSVW